MNFSCDDDIRASLLFSQQLKSSIDRIVKYFQQVHPSLSQTLNEIKRNHDDTDFQEAISLILDQLSLSEVDHLEANAHTVFDSYGISDRPTLVVFGPNSSGKTSFIQRFLNIGNILPSGIGPVTARIVYLTYAAPEKASFCVYDTIERGSIQHHESLASFFVDQTEPDWLNISQRLLQHVQRPNNVNINSSEFSDWAKSFIEIRLPSNILQLGIDLYDTPGFLSERREEILMANLYRLVKSIRPTLLFLYENATINETERSCFLAMKDALHGLERVPVFFLNTKADCISIANDFMLDDDPDNVSQDLFEKTLLDKRQRCYNLLLKRNEMAHEVLGALPLSVEHCICFDICTTPPDYDPWETYTALINRNSFRRIVRFAVETFSIPAVATTKDMLIMVDNYFDILATTTPRSNADWTKLHDEAVKWGEEFFEKFLELIPKLVANLTNNIQQLFQQLRSSIAQRAAATERPDDPIDQLLQDNAKTVRQYLQVAVREQIVKVATNQTIIQQRDEIEQAIAGHFERQKGMRRNELLAFAQRRALSEFSIDPLAGSSWVESIIEGMIKLNMEMKRYFYSFSTSWSSFARRKLNRLRESQQTTIDDDVFALLDAMDSYANLSNENNRRLYADTCLTKLSEEILRKAPNFASNLNTWICRQKRTFINLVNKIHRVAGKGSGEVSSLASVLNVFYAPLARIESRLLSVQEISKRKGIPPSIDSPIGQGGFYSVHAAHWMNDKNLAVKKLREISAEHEEMMVLEIHYHRLVTRLCSDYVAPLLYVYENSLPNDHTEFWIIMPRYHQSLQEYLKAQMNNLSFEQSTYWALTIAKALEQLHRFDLTHRDLKSSNVMIDDNQRCHLIDFGTVKIGLCNQTLLGTLPLPPEMLTDTPVSYDGSSADIYCFGLLLYELLPKPTYDRLDSKKLSTLEDLLTLNPKYDENTKDFGRLMLDCLQKNPNLRPRSDVVIARLAEIQKKAEVKLCTVCEERERTLRFSPCNHKSMCEACWQSWSTQSAGRAKCILCKTVVENYALDTDNATFIVR